MDSLSKGMGWMAVALCLGLAWSLWMAVQGGITERRAGSVGVGGAVLPSFKARKEGETFGAQMGVARHDAERVVLAQAAEVWVFDEQGDPVANALVCAGTAGAEGEIKVSDEKGRAFVPLNLAQGGRATWVRAGNDASGWGEAEYPLKSGNVVQIVLSREVARNISLQSAPEATSAPAE